MSGEVIHQGAIAGMETNGGTIELFAFMPPPGSNHEHDTSDTHGDPQTTGDGDGFRFVGTDRANIGLRLIDNLNGGLPIGTSG